MPNLSAILGSVQRTAALLWGAFFRLVKILFLIPLFLIHVVIYNVNALVFEIIHFYGGLLYVLAIILLPNNLMSYVFLMHAPLVPFLINLWFCISTFVLLCFITLVFNDVLRRWLFAIVCYPIGYRVSYKADMCPDSIAELYMEYKHKIMQLIGEYEIKSFIKDCYYLLVSLVTGNQKVGSTEKPYSAVHLLRIFLVVFFSSSVPIALLYSIWSGALPVPFVIFISLMAIMCVTRKLRKIIRASLAIIMRATSIPEEPKDNNALYDFLLQLYLFARLSSISVLSIVAFNIITPVLLMPLIVPYATYILVVTGPALLLLIVFYEYNSISYKLRSLSYALLYTAGFCYLIAKYSISFVFAPYILSIVLSVGIGAIGGLITLKIVDFLAKSLMLSRKIRGLMMLVVPQQLEYMPYPVQEIIVKEDPLQFRYASDRIKNYKEVVLAAVKQDGSALQYVGYDMKSYYRIENDREVTLAAVTQDGSALQYASHYMKDEKEVVLAAVRQDGSALQYAGCNMRNNEEVVRAAVAENIWALTFADFRVVETILTENVSLLENPQFFSVLLEKHHYIADKIFEKYASDAFKGDKDIVLSAVGQNGLMLKYVSDNLKNDYDVVLAAVRQNSYALRYARARLKGNKDIVLAAVGQNGFMLNHACESLKDDYDVVLAAVSNNAHALRFASDIFKSNKIIVLVAVGQNVNALQYAGEKINTKDKLISAIRANSKMFSGMNSSLFKGVGSTMAVGQALLRESILAEAFVQNAARGLYLKLHAFLSYVLYEKGSQINKGLGGKIYLKLQAVMQCVDLVRAEKQLPKLNEDCANNILSFIFPNYNPEEMNILCASCSLNSSVDLREQVGNYESVII